MRNLDSSLSNTHIAKCDKVMNLTNKKELLGTEMEKHIQIYWENISFSEISMSGSV